MLLILLRALSLTLLSHWNRKGVHGATQRFNYDHPNIHYGLLDMNRQRWTVSGDAMVCPAESGKVYFFFRGKSLRLFGQGFPDNFAIYVDGNDFHVSGIDQNTHYGEDSEWELVVKGLGTNDHSLIIHGGQDRRGNPFGLRYIEVDYDDSIGYLPARTGPYSTDTPSCAINVVNASDFIPQSALIDERWRTPTFENFLFHFTGTTLCIFGNLEWGYGGNEIWVQVDKLKPAAVSPPPPYGGSQQLLWNITGLPNTSHQVKVNRASDWPNIAFICIDGEITGISTTEGATIRHPKTLSPGGIAGIVIGVLIGTAHPSTGSCVYQDLPMFVIPNLESIPISSLKITYTCWDGLLGNFTQHWNFIEDADYWQKQEATAALVYSWRSRLLSEFQNITDSEIITYLSEARETRAFYDRFTAPGLLRCTRGLDAENAFCLATGNWDAIPSCLGRASDISGTSCEIIPVTGNPDISGVGLFSTYIIMTAVFSVLAIAHALYLCHFALCHRQKTPFSVSSPVNLLNSASLAFLDITIFLSISLLVAGASSVASRDTSRYEGIYALSVSSISVPPVLTMTAIMYSNLRRRRLKVFSGFVIAVFYVLHWYLWLTWGKPENEEIQSEEGQCMDTSPVIGTYILAGFLHVYIMVLFRKSVAHIPRYMRSISRSLGSCSANLCLGDSPDRTVASKKPESIDEPTKCQIASYMFSIVWGLAFTWTNLWAIVKTRQYSLMNRSSDNTENRMSYGQIVSLFIWLPFCIDLVYTLFYGSRGGLEGKIPKPFIVVEPEETLAS
ncbi:hypothetical protein CPB86DRAFT_870820 [Serendipita vermifera]|nr:hypothetical protein CPB86DRAFT_870820 [Serendipita vermifera]